MKRREFIAGLGGAVAWPLGASAQSPQLTTIGFLSSGSRGAFAPLVAAYYEGMREFGYVEGRNIAVIYAWAEGDYAKLDALANDLVRREVKLIVATGGLVSAKAAMKATPTISVVFVGGFDPAELGLVAKLNRPSGNATGASVFSTELLPKRLELLYDLAPQIQTAGVLMNPGTVTADRDAKDLLDAAQRKGYRIRFLPASSPSEIDAAFAAVTQQNVSAVLVTADPLFTTRRDQIVALAARQAIPVMYPWREYVEAGGLMSYGAELTWGYFLAGQYAARILHAEKPGDLPVQQPTKFEFVINLKTAKALGLAVPPNLLALADEVIE
jgi:putative tryptophan/tyrosine transport system substrate-binding protein